MMGNKRLLASSLLLISPFAAHAVETSYVFDSVSAIQLRTSNVSITGILAGNSTPTTISVPASSGPNVGCDRLYTMTLSQPGAYTLTVTTDTQILTYPGDPTQYPVTTLLGCALASKP